MMVTVVTGELLDQIHNVVSPRDVRRLPPSDFFAKHIFGKTCSAQASPDCAKVPQAVCVVDHCTVVGSTDIHHAAELLSCLACLPDVLADVPDTRTEITGLTLIDPAQEQS